MSIQINSEKEKLCIETIQQMLSKEYWVPGITVPEIMKGINNSALVVGAYEANENQIGFLRVISDKVRFAYLLDVVVQKSHRHKGIGQRMVQYAMSHPQLKDVYQWLLITKDAHGVYEKCGYKPLPYPERWMAIWNQRPDRAVFTDS